MRPLDLALAPWRTVQVIARAADDLNAVAERARRDPDPVDEARQRLDGLFTEVETLIAAIRTVDASAVALSAGGEDLLMETRALHVTARAIESGGRDLTMAAKDLARSLHILRAALPRLLEGLDTVEQLEESVETVAETVEPLKGVARGVGRVSDRLSPGRN
jgi:ABC-type transporter Mla subunit MlaD